MIKIKHQIIMGKLINGINGPFKGKAGSVIGSSRNGVSYIKGPYKKRTKKVSKPEKENQGKFAEAQLWLSPLKDYVREGFKGYPLAAAGFSGALSNLLLNAVEGTKEEPKVNPSLALVSFGNLPLSANVKAAFKTTHEIEFTWDTAHVEDASADDQVMLLAYDIKNKKPHISLTGQFRKTGSDTLKAFGKAGATYHVYLAFIAADRSRQSDSIYLGALTR